MVATYKVTSKCGGEIKYIQVEGVANSTQAALVCRRLCVNNNLPSANVEFVCIQDHTMTYTFNEATTERNLLGGR
jgi:hypothetical protein